MGLTLRLLPLQDLDADLKGMRDEVGASVRNEDFGKAKSDSLRQRLDKQVIAITITTTTIAITTTAAHPYPTPHPL